MVGRILNEIIDIAAGEQRKDHLRISLVFAEVVDGNDVRMIAETSHGLGFALDARSGVFIELFRLYLGKSNVTVKDSVMGKVDPLFAALAKELLDLIAASCE